MRDISLPQLVAPNKAGPGIKRSRRSSWRALSLLLVNVVIIAHIIHWKVAGSTVSPVEPSEAMYTLEQGQLNAGFIFLVVAMLSVIVFGRFVCGWGCHILALQDLCGWIMRRAGVRPKQFRTRLLGWAPLIIALYMFVWPTFEREVVAPILRQAWPAGLVYLGDTVPDRPDSIVNATITDDFWATFPAVAVAIPFLLVVGFGTVYFLGSKGFCAYGCPYGAVFGALDKVSVGRIVVDHDKCDGCGHCTAACTSNVRVHEEIREYGMVVNPGCMKDTDCISVCPKEALSFKITKPSIAKGAPKHTAPKRVYDLSRGEELGIAAVFLIIFFATRGAYGIVPMLFAVGLAGCGSFLVWKAWRVLRDRDVRLNPFQLKRAGRIRSAGWVTLIMAVVAVPALANGALVKVIRTGGDFDDRRVAVPEHIVLGGRTDLVTEQHRFYADRAIERYEFAQRLSVGLGRIHVREDVDFRIAWLKLTLGETEEAAQILTRLAGDHPDNETFVLSAAITLRLMERFQEAMALYNDAISAHPEFSRVRRELAGMLTVTGKPGEAERLYLEGLEINPDDHDLRTTLGVLLAAQGRAEESVEQLRIVAEQSPESASAQNDLAVSLFAVGEHDRAIELMERACELDAANPRYPAILAQMLDRLGRQEQAARWREESNRRRGAGATGS